MFAGNMKLRTFLLITVPIVGVIAAAGVYGVAVVAVRAASERAAEREARDQARQAEMDAQAARVEAERAELRQAEAARDPPAKAPVPIEKVDPFANPDRPWDAAVAGWQGKDLGAEKKKDVTKGEPYKVNVYQDGGSATCNRAKVDIDRDDKWDEKWTFEDGGISRKVAPRDDEDYTETYVWSGDAWVAE